MKPYLKCSANKINIFLAIDEKYYQGYWRINDRYVSYFFECCRYKIGRNNNITVYLYQGKNYFTPPLEIDRLSTLWGQCQYSLII